MNNAKRLSIYLVFSLFAVLNGLGCSAQSISVEWKTLADVKFERKYDSVSEEYYWFPIFGEKVKALAGKQITISGFIIPVSIEAGLYVLSAYPYASCFFCGGAGPESVIELDFKKNNKTYKTDQRMTFVGKLQLNADDILRMNYILKNAEEYTEK
jgi:hypothetical protein